MRVVMDRRVRATTRLGGTGAYALFVVALVLTSRAALGRNAETRAGNASNADADAAVPPTGMAASGPLLAYATPPTFASPLTACSFRTPICVHTSRDFNIAASAMLHVLDAADRIWETLTEALRFPAPDGDDANGRYAIFVVPAAGFQPHATTRLASRDVRSRFDRAAGFTVLFADGASIQAETCAVETQLARALVRAVMLRTAPATSEAIAEGQAAYVASELASCTRFGKQRDFQPILEAAAFQSHPNIGWADVHANVVHRNTYKYSTLNSPPIVVRSNPFAAGAAMAWSRIDWAHGRSPLSTVMAAWALTATITPLASARWNDEPDTFDVLRESFRGALFSDSSLDDLMQDTAIARAFAGDHDGGVHLPCSRWLDAAGRIAIDWDIPWPTRARRLLSRTPVQPTGSSYVIIRRQGAPANARLRVELEWEDHARFVWSLVKVSAAGAETGRIAIGTPERATSASITLVDMGEADHLLLVGTNAGDPAYRFDPDDDVWEPHAWLLTVASE